MDFIQLQVTCEAEWQDVLIAELSQLGYDAFMQEDDGFTASIEQDRYEEDRVSECLVRYQELAKVKWQSQKVARENWNQKWETNYEPIRIGNQCIVRASFHPLDKDYRYDIVINPKMSFGTGHHATTQLMLEQQLELDHEGKKVLEAGCGTGVLTIMAGKRGAKEILAYDIDDWAVENTNENLALNSLEATVWQGTAETIPDTAPFDIILANINKNILLEELSFYTNKLKAGGFLLLSGFYEADIPDLVAAASEEGLEKKSQHIKNDWACVVLQKKNGA